MNLLENFGTIKFTCPVVHDKAAHQSGKEYHARFLSTIYAQYHEYQRFMGPLFHHHIWQGINK